MPKLKLDEKGNVVVQDGKPVYVGDDGKDVAYDLPGLLVTIQKTRDERDGFETKLNEASTRLKGFGSITPEEAAKAVETVRNIGDNKLVTAGKLDDVVKERLAEQAKGYDAKLAEKDTVIASKDGQIRQITVSNGFAGSKFIAEKCDYDALAMEALFGKHFEFDGKQTIAKGADGKPIFSRERPGDYASVDEALDIIVSGYPHRDRVLKADVPAGSGATTTTPPPPGGKDLSALPPEARMAAAFAGGKA